MMLMVFVVMELVVVTAVVMVLVLVVARAGYGGRKGYTNDVGDKTDECGDYIVSAATADNDKG